MLKVWSFVILGILTAGTGTYISLAMQARAMDKFYSQLGLENDQKH